MMARSRSHFLAVPILAALLLAALLLSAAPAASSAEPTPVQVFDLGGQWLTYQGKAPLRVESGVYWDEPLAAAQAVVAIDSEGPHLRISPGPTDRVRLIVQLEGEALAVQQAALKTPEAVRRQADRLRAAQADLLRDLAAQGIAVSVQRRFVHAYNGLALAARAGDRAAIAQTPGVRAVYADYRLDALLPESVPLIGAPAVWAMTGPGGQPVTGGGVRVAVIDTGLDYDHPDLGGPGFPNTRVISGYNFVSDTVDPWDDMGHGTHVAGIVGASGHLSGVAPAASLLAYKVVDAQTGQAQTSDTIAALERALDPDGDPGSDDGAQVINISLGGPGDPDDPLSQACDNAVLAGAVVVVGAGNGGPRYQSLTSPGLARRVIGVGAADKSDVLWTYSSRGPVPGSWEIKPDLVAPGVSISSTIPGGYAEGSGTSASTAHVSGAAALLRQLYPAWSPEFVQAALMNTALDLGRSPYEQGAGRLQVDRAAATPALILPPSLSLGRVDASLPTWTRRATLTVHNVSTAPVTYTLSVAASFPAGVTTTVTPAQVVVAPGSLATVAFSLTVDTTVVPDVAGGSYAYWGALLATPVGLTAPDLRLPFAFVKAPLLRLHLDEPNVSVMFLQLGDPLLSRYAWPTTTTSDHLLPAGEYDVVVQYRQPYAYIVRTITLSESVELTIPRSAAFYEARIFFSDENGQPATPNHAFHRFMRGGNGWLVPETVSITEITYFSPVPAAYTWERTVADADPSGDAYRQWHGRAEGVSGHLAFSTSPADFAPVEHPLRPLPGATAYSFREMVGYATPYYAYMVGPAVPTVTVPYTRRAYYRSPPPGHELYVQRAVIPDPAPNFFDGALTTPWLQLDADRNLTWGQPRNPADTYYRLPTGGLEPLGLGPLHCFAQFAVEGPDSLRLLPAVGNSLFFRAFQGGEVSWELRQPYELRQGDTLLQSGDVGFSTSGSQVEIDLPAAGAYSLTLPFTYTLGTTEVVTAYGRVVAEFDTAQYETDASPPFVEALRLLDDLRGQPVDVAAGPVELRLVVSDTVDLSPSVTVAYDVGGGWTTIPVAQEVGEYVAHLPAFPDGTDVRLRIAAADAAGNMLTHFLEPAYLRRGQRLYLPLVLKGRGEN